MFGLRLVLVRTCPPVFGLTRVRLSYLAERKLKFPRLAIPVIGTGLSKSKTKPQKGTLLQFSRKKFGREVFGPGGSKGLFLECKRSLLCRAIINGSRSVRNTCCRRRATPRPNGIISTLRRFPRIPNLPGPYI